MEIMDNKSSTKQDIQLSEFALRADMKAMETSIRADMKAMEVTLRSEIKDVDSRLKTNFQELKSDLLSMQDKIIIKLSGVMIVLMSAMVAAQKIL